MATPWRFGAAFLFALLLAGSAQAQIYSNATGVTIPANPAATHPAAANPYPSTITVAGFSGSVTDLNVTLTGLTHSWANDMDIMLVGPTGVRIMLMSDAVGGGPITNRTYTFDSEATAALPTTGFPASGSYRPTNSGTTDPFPTPAPTTPALVTTLTAYNGFDPNGTWRLFVVDDTEGDVGTLASWSLRFNNFIAPAAFGVSPGAVNFQNAGVCTGFGSETGTISVSNTGGTGTVSVTGASLTGSPAYTLTTQPTYPANLAGGASTNFVVTFNPMEAQTGPQTAALTVTYTVDGGAAQTATVSLYGTGDAEGAGIAFRSSAATEACANGVAAPGTALVPLTGHTRITTWTDDGATGGDDSYFALTLPAGFPSLRLFGTDYTSMRINSNALINFAAVDASAFYGGLPASGDVTIQVGAMDVDLRTSTVGGDNTGEFGAPGVFYGLSDVDADGDQELVITWWHAYDYASTAVVYPAAGAPFFTAQLIVYQADRPNAEDLFEMRFPSGNDANGVPYRNNTAATGGIETTATVGIGEGNGVEAAIYRTATATTPAGGSLYPAGGSLGVRFAPETQEEADGQAGWRMLSTNVLGYTVGRLAGVNLVQGVTGQYPTYGDNLLTNYDGTNYVAAGNVTDVLTPGRGFMWYMYDQTFDPGDVDGTSNSYELPTPLQGTGVETVTNAAGVYPITLHAAGSKWNMVGNPYRDDFDFTNIGSWATGGALASSVGQTWDPNAGSTGSYVILTNNRASAWQGFMIENNTATALNVPPRDRVTGVELVGREATRMVAFELAGRTADTDAPTLDQAAILYFGEDGTADWDLRDAGKLQPLAARYATLAFVGERDGETVLKAQESRALEAGSFDVPLAVSAVGTAGELTLTWPTFQNVPADWAFTLRDMVTGAVVDLRQQTSYTFTTTAARAAGVANGMPVLGAAEARVADARFVLHVASATTGTEGAGALPTAFALHAPAPNPIVGVSALVSYDLPEASATRIEVYDMLGRRVATVVDGTVEAGRHTARLDASALASGSYVVRMTAGSFAQAQRVTVTR